MRGTKVSDISPLEGCGGLRELDLSSTKVTNVSTAAGSQCEVVPYPKPTSTTLLKKSHALIDQLLVRFNELSARLT